MTITLTREEAQQVLDAFLGIEQRAYDAMSGDAFHECSIAVSRLRARLAQPEPEPVMLMDAPLLLNGQPLYTAQPQAEPKPVADKYLMEVECTKCGAKQDGILTVNAPPQREWQGLTDDEAVNTLDEVLLCVDVEFLKRAARAIEAKLKEKNA